MKSELLIPDEEDFKKAKHELSKPAIEQGTWLTQPLWNHYDWKTTLESYDINWQEFMEEYPGWTFVKWSKGEVTWEEAMDKLIERLNDIVE